MERRAGFVREKLFEVIQVVFANLLQQDVADGGLFKAFQINVY